MSDEIMARKYEFFSWQGFTVGAVVMVFSLIVQSLISFNVVWTQHAVDYALFIAFSSIVVGIASGGVLVYLFPPDQDVIGIAGLGSDDFTQHLSLILVILALVQPIFTGFVFFYEYFSVDPLIFIWVLLGFAAPSLGLTTAMFERSRAIGADLRVYFAVHEKLDMASLDWLHAIGPRTATYRMGMLESAARRVGGLKITGHEIVRESKQFAVNP
ncbi:MAG: hypothetical protein KGD60_01520 [Candidatus Thorarchaeota archaeon]|nr:hypothetical protein [Candidatus Thorarchaeota archaeon]